MNIPNEWAKARRIWIKNNPPNHQGYWICAICGRWTQDLEVDHILPRSGSPELRFNQDNLQGLCPRCNQRKGSTHGKKGGN